MATTPPRLTPALRVAACLLPVLLAASTARGQTLIAPPTGAGNFGRDVALSGDLLVASDREAVHAFRHVQGAWTLEATFDEAFAPELADVGGWVLAVEGDTVLLGDPYDDVDGENAGAVHHLERVSGRWTYVERLSPGARRGSDAYGWCLALDGDVLAVGAPREGGLQTLTGLFGAGRVHVLRRQGGRFVETQLLAPQGLLEAVFILDAVLFGRELLLDGGRLFVDTQGTRVSGYELDAGFGAQGGPGPVTPKTTTMLGTISVLEDGPDGFTLQGLLLDRRDEFGNDVTPFTRRLAARGDTLLQGVPSGFSAVDPRGGTLARYERTGALWSQVQGVANPSPAVDDAFGRDVALDGDRLVALSRKDATGTSPQFASVELFDWSGPEPLPVGTIDVPEDDPFGFSFARLALSGDRLVLGLSTLGPGFGSSAPGGVLVYELGSL